jgi:hypothetical protein
MKKIIVLILAALLTFSFAFSVAAQEDTRRAMVEKLMVLTKQDRLYEQVFPQFKQLVLQQVKQLNVTPDQSPLIDKFWNKMFDLMKEEMSWEKTKEDFIQLYISVYTEEELQELIKFYESPVGQKMIAKMPLLMQQTMAISQKYTANMMPKIQKMVKELVDELINDENDENDEPQKEPAK